MFVDGYNVINAWPRLKKPFEKGELHVARTLLLDDCLPCVQPQGGGPLLGMPGHPAFAYAARRQL